MHHVPVLSFAAALIALPAARAAQEATYVAEACIAAPKAAALDRVLVLFTRAGVPIEYASSAGVVVTGPSRVELYSKLRFRAVVVGDSAGGMTTSRVLLSATDEGTLGGSTLIAESGRGSTGKVWERLRAYASDLGACASPQS